MRTTLRVTDLRVSCLIGCFAEERLREQIVRVDLELHLDAGLAAREDRLERTLDYGEAGRQGIQTYFERGAAVGLFPPTVVDFSP